jgi:hypothetical protein
MLNQNRLWNNFWELGDFNFDRGDFKVVFEIGVIWDDLRKRFNIDFMLYVYIIFSGRLSKQFFRHCYQKSIRENS